MGYSDLGIHFTLTPKSKYTPRHGFQNFKERDGKRSLKFDRNLLRAIDCLRAQHSTAKPVVRDIFLCTITEHHFGNLVLRRTPFFCQQVSWIDHQAPPPPPHPPRPPQIVVYSNVKVRLLVKADFFSGVHQKGFQCL